MPDETTARYQKRVRMVRPGYIGISIGEHDIEYVMPVSEANDLIGLINRAKHDGESNAE